MRPGADVKDTHVQIFPGVGIEAGDVAGPSGCLTDAELDFLLGQDLVVPAGTFFRVIHGEITLQSVAEALRRRATEDSKGKSEISIAIVWVRHHWVVMSINHCEYDEPTRSTQRARASFYDSAPSAPVRRDLEKLARALDLVPVFEPCPRQITGSNECGLFAFMNAALISRGLRVPSCTDHISLAELRRLWPDRDAMMAAGASTYGLPSDALQGIRKAGAPRTETRAAKRETAATTPLSRAAQIRNMTHEEARNHLGEEIYNALSGRQEVAQITGMLLELPNHELLYLLDDSTKLSAKADECERIIQLHAKQPLTQVLGGMAKHAPITGATAVRDAGHPTNPIDVDANEHGSPASRVPSTVRTPAKCKLRFSSLPSADAALNTQAAELDHSAASLNLCFCLVGAVLLMSAQRLLLQHWGKGSVTTLLCKIARALGLRTAKDNTSRNEQMDVFDFFEKAGVDVGLVADNGCLQGPVWPSPARRFIVRFSAAGQFREAPQLRAFSAESMQKAEETLESTDKRDEDIESAVASPVLLAYFHGKVSSVGAYEGHYTIRRTKDQPPKDASLAFAVYELDTSLPTIGAIKLTRTTKGIIVEKCVKGKATVHEPVPTTRHSGETGKKEAASVKSTKDKKGHHSSSKHNEKEGNPPKPDEQKEAPNGEKPSLSDDVCAVICGPSCLGFCRKEEQEAVLSEEELRQQLRALSIGDEVLLRWSWESKEQAHRSGIELSSSASVQEWRLRITKTGRNVTAEYTNADMIREVLIPSEGVRYHRMQILPRSTGKEDGRQEGASIRRHEPYKAAVMRSRNERLWHMMTHSAVTKLVSGAAGSKRWCEISMTRSAKVRWGDECETEDKDAVFTIMGQASKTEAGPVISVHATRCRDCGGWEMEEQPFDLDLPQPHCTYFNGRIIQSDVTGSVEQCNCADREEVMLDATGIKHQDFQHELRADASLFFTARGEGLTGKTASKWWIPLEKPAHVHSLSWHSLAPSTRRGHMRWLRILKECPAELHKVPLGTVAIHCVLEEARKEEWTSWGTVACALSGIASALKRLTEYTGCKAPIDLKKESPAFADACRRAQHLARITKTHTAQEAMSRTQYEGICNKIKDPQARVFFMLSWEFAARLGDLRQVHTSDINFHPIRGGTTGSKRHPIAITFRYGKGAAFWGPFTVLSQVDDYVAQTLRQLVRERKRGAIFTPTHQTCISGAVKEGGLSSVRSIRRGRLQYLADLGTTNEELRLLSGHKRVDTLLRYLGWGSRSSDGKSAAAHRAQREAEEDELHNGDDEESQSETIYAGGTFDPPKMGIHSGYSGQKGQRVAAPPSFLPKRPPKSRALGIHDEGEDSWELKAKKIGTLDWDRVRSTLNSRSADPALGKHLLSDEDWGQIERMVTESQKWCGKEPMVEQGLGARKYSEDDIPFTNIRREDFDVINEAEKFLEMTPGEDILGWVVGYIIPQRAKKQRRPVWEPSLNRDNLEGQPTASYPARRVRRYLKGYKFTGDFDAKAWFDQFSVRDAANFYVARYRIFERDGTITEKLVKLARLPMGATFAPAVAQNITSAIIAPLKRLSGVKVFSMIDNVRIAAQTRKAFDQAVAIFLNRCKSAGVVLNDLEWTEYQTSEPVTRKVPIDGMTTEDWTSFALASKVFLGEETDTEKGRIRNAPKNSAKLKTALEKLQAGVSSFRHIVSIISMVFYLQHTHDIHLVESPELLKSYSNLCATASRSGYDAVLTFLDQRLLARLRHSAKTLERLDQSWSQMPDEPSCPSSCDSDYDIILTTDASATGWAASVFFTKSQDFILLQQNWWKKGPNSPKFEQSTVAEPIAIVRAFSWLESEEGRRALSKNNVPHLPRVALVTDHGAVVEGQQRWWSQNGGFSLNIYLNSAFAAMKKFNCTAFHIPGVDNPMDGPSRATGLGTMLKATVVGSHVHMTPALAELQCPYLLCADNGTDHRVEATCVGGDTFRLMG